VQQVAGKTGRVVSVDSDGDVKVDIAGGQWLLNPLCCIVDSSAATSRNDGNNGNNSNSGNNSKAGGNDDAVGERNNAIIE
jgi:hypothetical protein